MSNPTTKSKHVNELPKLTLDDLYEGFNGQSTITFMVFKNGYAHTLDIDTLLEAQRPVPTQVEIALESPQPKTLTEATESSLVKTRILAWRNGWNQDTLYDAFRRGWGQITRIALSGKVQKALKKLERPSLNRRFTPKYTGRT